MLSSRKVEPLFTLCFSRVVCKTFGQKRIVVPKSLPHLSPLSVVSYVGSVGSKAGVLLSCLPCGLCAAFPLCGTPPGGSGPGLL